LKIGIDATYSVGRSLSGVGVYSIELMRELAAQHPETRWDWLYRPHRIARSFQEAVPANVHRGLLFDGALWRNTRLFHGLNQRLPARRFALQVATFHDLFVMTGEYSTPEFRRRFTEQARHAAKQADRIIAVSAFTAEQVISLLGVESTRVSVVPHGVRPLPKFGAAREKIVLHVGAIQKRKNLVRLVRAFAALPGDWRLVLAGSSGYGADEVFAEIERSKCRNRITVTGYASAAELGKLYAQATVFAFPSLDEGFGMPVLEAMSAGVPVIASNSSAVGEVAGNAAILINPENEDELAAALKQAAEEEDLRNWLVAGGLERANAFTWRRAAIETWAVYQELVGRRGDS
jgi:glycosyltransferase involved in cell wall biosynthesis